MNITLNKLKKFNSFNCCIFISIFIWLGLLSASLFVKNGHAIIDFLSVKIEFIVHFITIFILAKICFYLKKTDRRNMLWLLTVNIILFIIDLAYYILAYSNNDWASNPVIKFSLDYLPEIIGCFLIIFFISTVLLRKILSNKKFIVVMAIFILLDLVVMMLFLSAVKGVYVINWQKIAHIIILSEQIIQFNCAIIGLIYAVDIGAIFLLIGFIILLASAYFYTSQILIFFPYAELLWLLGLIFIMLNAVCILCKKTYITEIWFKKENTIKNQLAFFTFTLSMFGFLVFFCIAYTFPVVNKAIFLGLPLFTMMYSIIAVVLSIAVGKKFEIPFKKIEKNIESLKHLDKAGVENNFSIEEFIYLQKFIVNAFEYKEEKDKAKKQIGELTAQVAHDIRSPLAAIDTIIGSSENRVMTESEKVMLRTAFRRINNITNDLVAKYKGRPHEPDTLVFLYVAIKDIVSEKDLEYSRCNIQFKFEIDSQESAFLLTEGNYKEINRIFSNVINNSVASMEDGGIIKIKFKRDLQNIIVDIIDQGKGISNEKIKKMLSEDKNLNIGEEIGFGLNHAKNYLKKHGGDIRIFSSKEAGTEVKLSFPISLKPKWLAKKLNVDLKKPVIVIDDDTSIHDIWIKKFDGLNLLKEDFYTIEHARQYLYNNNINDGVILCDHEFFGKNETGMSFLESIKHLEIDKYLVTTHVNSYDIIECCENNNIQIIPKHLLPYVAIYEKVSASLSCLKKQSIPDAILIDDEVYNHEYWKYKAKKSNKLLHCYTSLEDFIIYKNPLLYEIPIYIDLHLKNVSGLEVAKILYKEGFISLYITTGFIDCDISRHPYIKHIIGKSPPF